METWWVEPYFMKESQGDPRIHAVQVVKLADVAAMERRVKWLEEGLGYIKQFLTSQPDVKSGIENAHREHINLRRWLAAEPPKEG